MKSWIIASIFILAAFLSLDGASGEPERHHRHRVKHHRRQQGKIRRHQHFDQEEFINSLRNTRYDDDEDEGQGDERVQGEQQQQQQDEEYQTVDEPLQQQQQQPRQCSSCVDRELFKNFTREEIKDKILRKLDLSAPPNVTTDAVPVHLVRQLLSKYRGQLVDHQRMNSRTADGMLGDDPYSLLDDEDDDFHFQTRQINVISQEPPAYTLPDAIATADLLYFNLAQSNQLRENSERVVAANLWVFLPEAAEVDDEHAFVEVHAVNLDRAQNAVTEKVVDAKVRLRVDRGGWVDIKLLKVVMNWLEHPYLNLGLVIRVKTARGVELPLDRTAAKPFLQLDIRENLRDSASRRKRQLNKVCTEERDAGETHCCLWPFTIDFERDFGWKWIIHPPQYEANYCSGDCSLGVMMPSNPYSHLLQQANGTPCCAPQKMSGMNMLYMDENKNVILGKLPNMKVERCGCT